MRKHWLYLKYLMRHKWFVFVAGLRTGAPLWRLINSRLVEAAAERVASVCTPLLRRAARVLHHVSRGALAPERLARRTGPVSEQEVPCV